MRRIDGPGEGAVVNLDVQFGHSVGLENSSGWPGAEKSEIVLPGIQGELAAVEGPLDRGEPEVRDQAVRDPALHHGREHRVFGLDFHAIEIFEAPQLHSRRPEVLEVHKRLFQKYAGVV